MLTNSLLVSSHSCRSHLEDEGVFGVSGWALLTGRTVRCACSWWTESMDAIFLRLFSCFCKTVAFVSVCTQLFLLWYSGLCRFISVCTQLFLPWYSGLCRFSPVCTQLCLPWYSVFCRFSSVCTQLFLPGYSGLCLFFFSFSIKGVLFFSFFFFC